VNAVEAADGPEGAETPARTLDDAAQELRALRRQLNARKRAGRDARFLEQLQAQSARRRSAVADPTQHPEAD